jgi:hypothetical protein
MADRAPSCAGGSRVDTGHSPSQFCRSRRACPRCGLHRSLWRRRVRRVPRQRTAKPEPKDAAFEKLGLGRTVSVVVPGYADALPIARQSNFVVVVPRSCLGNSLGSDHAATSGLESAFLRFLISHFPAALIGRDVLDLIERANSKPPPSSRLSPRFISMASMPWGSDSAPIGGSNPQRRALWQRWRRLRRERDAASLAAIYGVTTPATLITRIWDHSFGSYLMPVNAAN